MRQNRRSQSEVFDLNSPISLPPTANSAIASHPYRAVVDPIHLVYSANLHQVDWGKGRAQHSQYLHLLTLLTLVIPVSGSSRCGVKIYTVSSGLLSTTSTITPPPESSY